MVTVDQPMLKLRCAVSALNPKLGRVPLILLLISVFASTSLHATPDALLEGVIQFEVERGNYFGALSQFPEQTHERFPISYAAAMSGFGMSKDSILKQLDRSKADKKSLTADQRFRIGRVYYKIDECIEALKAFKGLTNKLGLEEKQEWAFYRANCSIILGSKKKAAQVLSDILSGLWISHAYYNLSMAYSASSTNKTKALVALRVASSLNPGETRAEKELNDRIFFAAGSFYLQNEKPRLALDFFKKVNLDSMIAPQALYMHGVALLEEKDFRAATQSWFSARKYATIQQGVAEALLAIPYAFEGSGYTTQALEAYFEASNTFKKELERISKVKKLVKKHGVRKVLIEENDLAELEWFLAKDVAKNTQRAAYYTYLMQAPEIYDTIQTMTELQLLKENQELWQDELNVFDVSLKSKSSGFKKRSSSFAKQNFSKQIKSIARKAEKVGNSEAKGLMVAAAAELSAREKSLSVKIKQGRAQLSDQQKSIKSYKKLVSKNLKALDALIARHDKHISDLAMTRFQELEQSMTANFEKAEQGLVHILETIAEANNPVRNRLDGRYQ